MISSEVQRTLVKSPPELWSELSDPVALARHLSDFGEIRITRVEAERSVEWEAQDASGSVQIKPSGWGTRVTLTAKRPAPQPEPEASAPDTQDETPQPAPELQASAPEPELPADSEPEPEPEPEPAEVAELASLTELAQPSTDPQAPDPASELPVPEPQPEHEPRRGLLARLFGRRRPEPAEAPVAEHAPVAAQEAPPAAEPEPERYLPFQSLTPPPSGRGVQENPARLAEPTPPAEPVPLAKHTPPAEPDPAPVPELDGSAGAAAPHRAAAVAQLEPETKPETQLAPTPSAAADLEEELRAAEEQVTAVLTSVLDRLGSAHHRPFSRA